MRVLLLGDVHGVAGPIERAVAESSERGGLPIYQVGDLRRRDQQNEQPNVPDDFRWIRGNWDSPGAAKRDPRYLGDFGIDPATGIFFLSGACTVIPGKTYQPGVNYWPDNEELSFEELRAAIEFYAAAKPEVVLTHTAPNSPKPIMLRERDMDRCFCERTSMALEEMFRIHQPRAWYFGHFHRDWQDQIGRTEFACIGTGRTLEVAV